MLPANGADPVGHYRRPGRQRNNHARVLVVTELRARHGLYLHDRGGDLRCGGHTDSGGAANTAGDRRCFDTFCCARTRHVRPLRATDARSPANTTDGSWEQSKGRQLPRHRDHGCGFRAGRKHLCRATTGRGPDCDSANRRRNPRRAGIVLDGDGHGHPPAGNRHIGRQATTQSRAVDEHDQGGVRLHDAGTGGVDAEPAYS